jgi:hypothetical protein
MPTAVLVVLVATMHDPRIREAVVRELRIRRAADSADVPRMRTTDLLGRLR